MSWDGKSNKLKYQDSQVFHPTIKFGHKNDSFAFLEHGFHFKKVLEVVKDTVACVTLEGISYGSPGMIGTTGGVYGIYSTTALRYSDVVVCAPRSLKLWATGNGKAEKSDIEDAALLKYKDDGLVREYENCSKEEKKLFNNRTDAIFLAEVGFWSWRIMNEGIDKIRPLLKPHELEVVWNEAVNAGKKPKGICNRQDDFYLKKIEG